ncbi:YopX family protein [Cytobacillus horneckiae]|uniref:YopX family protein n=1 Tax=Cytobacillus horneckiae TaxID=549687 RepID=UPI003D9A9C76
MREIKIRAKSVENNQWIDDGWGIFESIPRLGRRAHYIYTDHGYYEVHKESIGQSTYLKDKTVTDDMPEGIEIFENDILFDPITNEKYVVKWDEYYACYFLKNTIDELNKQDYDFAEYDHEVGNGLYVIGNKFENPELINS